MSQQRSFEPFPAVSPHAHFAKQNSSNNVRTRIRRKSSSLGGDPRGDTGGLALATRNEGQKTGAIGRTPSEKADKLARPHSKRRKAKTLFNRWKRLSLRHTWLTPLIITLVILALYAVNPSESNPLHSAIFLSYRLPAGFTFPSPKGSPQEPLPEGQYGKGPKDFAFVAFYTVVLSFTREFLMQRVIRPAGLRLGIRSRAKLSRFMEQVYTAMYFAIFGPFGLYVMSRSPIWYFNTAAMYEGFPHRSHEALFKAYYLLQASYWAQQGLVLMLMLEKPRKDFKELVLHHIITLALIGLSYRFHFTYMGLAVYITHDISDFFLATSKTLNYIDSVITAPYFALFMGIWAYLRHYINLRIIFSIWTSFATVGPFELDWETQQYKCWISQVITFGLLASLQAVNCFWFVLIMRIAWRFVRKAGLADERSDDEDEGESEVLEEKANGEVGSPQVLLNGRPVGTLTGEDVGVSVTKRR